MTKLLVCVDGSPYADNIITHVAWAAKRLNAEIDLLHVLRLQSDYNAQSSDRTGTIGINARSSLMEELVKVDQERGKLDQQKGRLILEHAQEALQKVGVQQINSLYRRGSLADTITEFENDADIILLVNEGKQPILNLNFWALIWRKSPVVCISHYSLFLALCVPSTNLSLPMMVKIMPIRLSSLLVIQIC